MKKQLLLILLTSITCSVFSQSVKIGYINSLELIAVMPEAQAADSAIIAYAKELNAQYQIYLADAQALYRKIQDTSLSQVQYDAVAEDLQYAQKRVSDFEQSSKDKVTTKRQELYGPILQKATDVVKLVAKENGYTHVLDSSTGAIIVAPDGDNILALVKKKLDIK